MKTQILSIDGKPGKEITTSLFEEPIREDIIAKVVESEKIMHPWAPRFRAGMDISASGLSRKRRHVWKSDRGKGMARTPKKIMWRRGTQFNWVGAVIPGTRGGRKAHPPHGVKALKKINKKEYIKALLSSLSYVSSVEELKKKYSRLETQEVKIKLPLVVEDKILNLKTKEFLLGLKKILDNMYGVAVQGKSVRPGKGKMRGRKYKKSAGMLLVIGKEESKKVNGIDVVRATDLVVSDLASNGARLTMFTENAVKDLEKLTDKTKETIKK